MFTDEAGDQMTFFEWGASAAFSHEEAPALPFVHMATADPGFNVKIAERSEFASFDPGQDLHRYSKEQLDYILDHIKILFANHHEIRGMERILGMTEPGYYRPGTGRRGYKRERGSILHMHGHSDRVPALQVTMADPTGAGDAYRAGFLTAFSRDYDPLPPAGSAR